jgi:hypothetical protein
MLVLGVGVEGEVEVEVPAALLRSRVVVLQADRTQSAAMVMTWVRFINGPFVGMAAPPTQQAMYLRQ